MALPFLSAGVQALLVAVWSFWSPEKQLVIFQRTAVLCNSDPASRESSACAGEGSESRDDGDVLALRAGRSPSSFASVSPRLVLCEAKQKKEENPGCRAASEVGLKHCRVKAYEENERSCVQEKCILHSSGCQEDLCRA